MKIKNFNQLAVTEGRKAALHIAEAGFAAIDTARVVRNAVRFLGNAVVVQGKSFPLGKTTRIFVAGAGKCAAEAARALQGIFGERISGGVIVDVAQAAPLKNIAAYRGSHPLPSIANMEASANIVGLLKRLRKNDLVIFVVSGGGSTLLCLPQDTGCEEEVSVLGALTRAGATIREINTVRKHLSLARGGYLAKYAYPARAISLIFSDVPGNDVQFIASGPTVMDTTTVWDAEAILKKYDVLKTCGIKGCGLIETPKEDKYFKRVYNALVVSNSLALEAMAKKAARLGYVAEVCTACLEGEARDAAAGVVGSLRRKSPKTALLYGGETTVTVRGKGEGGRNMEFALATLQLLKEGEVVLALASDGRDNSDVAGAMCDIITKRNADKKRLKAEQYLNDNNEYPFFQAVGDYLMTGDTGSNVSDLIIALKS